MRLALFSDVHGSISGLRAVLAAVDRLGEFDAVVCAGDVVGWPGTSDLFDLLSSRGVRLVRGNGEDLYLDFAAETRGKNEQFLAPMRIRNEWLKTHYPQELRPAIVALPLTLTIEAAPGRRVLVCHSTPSSTTSNACRLNAPPEELRAAYKAVEADVVVHGHAHQHVVRWLPRGESRDPLLLVGVGSVGARADGLSAFTVLELAGGHLDRPAVPGALRRWRGSAPVPQARRAGHGGLPGLPPRHHVPAGRRRASVTRLSLESLTPVVEDAMARLADRPLGGARTSGQGKQAHLPLGYELKSV
jgi:predicted phosphodiesterase